MASSTKKIVLAAPLWPPEIGSAAQYAKELAERLHPMLPISVITYADFPELIRGIELKSTSKQMPLFARVAAFFFSLQKSHPSLILSHKAAASGLPSLLVSKILGAPFVVLFPEDEGWRPVVRLVLRSATRVLVPNEEMKKLAIKRGARESEVHIIPFPVPTPRILPFPEDTIDNEEKKRVWHASWAEHICALNSILQSL